MEKCSLCNDKGFRPQTDPDKSVGFCIYDPCECLPELMARAEREASDNPSSAALRSLMRRQCHEHE